MRKRFSQLGTSLVLLVITAIALVWLSPAVQDSLLTVVAGRAIEGGAGARLHETEGMRILLCGTSSPLPHPTRRKACVAVFAGGKFYVVDTGPGSWNNFARWRVAGERIGGIFYTHYHSDHIGALGEFNMQTWVAGRPEPLKIYGPPGVRRLVAGFAEAYALDIDYRVAHHGRDFLSPDRSAMEAVQFALSSGSTAASRDTPVFEEGELTVTAFPVDHDPIKPAVGYRFDYRGRSVVVSGDTVKDGRLIAQARGVDVLVHEAQASHILGILRKVADRAGRARIVTIMDDILDYHTTPIEAAEAANEADAKLLVLYHLNPPPPTTLIERVFMRGVDETRPEGVILADDGLVLELPPDSPEITISWLD